MSEFCHAYLDAVNRPFDNHKDGRIPDGYALNTAKIFDIADYVPLYAPVDTATDVIAGMGVVFSYGVNQLEANSYYVNGAVSSSSNQLVEGPLFFCVGTNGLILTLTNNAHTFRFFTYSTLNYDTIFGTTNPYGISIQNALVQSIRPINSGIRVWPVIELNTNSAVTSVSRYYGAQITPNVLYTSALNNAALITTLKGCSSYLETNNAKGMSGRLNPSQVSIFDLTTMQSIENLSINSQLDTDGIYFPILYFQFTATFTLSATLTTALPVNFSFRTEMESVLKQPTPIISDRPPYDPSWKQCLANLQYSSDLYPSITEGFSFKSVAKRFVLNSIRNPEIRRAAATVIRPIIRSNPYTNMAYNLGRTAYNLASNRNQQLSNRRSTQLPLTKMTDMVQNRSTRRPKMNKRSYQSKKKPPPRKQMPIHTTGKLTYPYIGV
jgi:hypothetical protein